jgi:hypothetical protein
MLVVGSRLSCSRTIASRRGNDEIRRTVRGAGMTINSPPEFMPVFAGAGMTIFLVSRSHFPVLNGMDVIPALRRTCPCASGRECSGVLNAPPRSAGNAAGLDLRRCARPGIQTATGRLKPTTCVPGRATKRERRCAAPGSRPGRASSTQPHPPRHPRTGEPFCNPVRGFSAKRLSH